MCTIYFIDIKTFDGNAFPPLVKDEEDMDLDDYPEVSHLARPGLRCKIDNRLQQDVVYRMARFLVDQGVQPIPMWDIVRDPHHVELWRMLPHDMNRLMQHVVCS